MATDENNHKNEARDDWTGCTFRVERGRSSEGRAWGMADILTDARIAACSKAHAAAILPRAELSRHRLMFIAQAFAGHAEDHWINVVTSRAGGAFAEVSLLAAAPRGHALHAVPTRPETTSSLRAFTASRYASPSRDRRASFSPGHRSAPRLKAATRRRRRAPRHERPRRRHPRPPRSSGRRASRATSWASSR